MAIEAVGASLSLASGATATITPPVGEVWALTRIWSSGSSNAYGSHGGYLRGAIGMTADVTTGSIMGAIVDTNITDQTASLSHSGTVIISNTKYLSLFAQSSGQGFSYSGIKL